MPLLRVLMSGAVCWVHMAAATPPGAHAQVSRTASDLDAATPQCREVLRRLSCLNGRCLTCAGYNQHALKIAGCTAAEISEICADTPVRGLEEIAAMKTARWWWAGSAGAAPDLACESTSL